MNTRANTERALASFLARSALLGLGSIAVVDNPTEELQDELTRGRDVKLYRKGMARRGTPQVLRRASAQTKAIARLEENYLFFSRRWPSSANNTIGAGALTVGTFPYFNRATGDDASGSGFPTGFTHDLTTTNLQLANQIPQGTSFVFNQIGVSFNSDAATGDINQLMEAAALQFTKAGGQFSLDHGPLKMWPSGMGTDGFSTATSVTAAHNGVSDIRAVRNLRIARVIKEKETFSYNLIFPRTTKAQNGASLAMSDFVIATIWLWGGQKNVIPT